MQGSRPERVGEEIRQELSALLAREVQDPGIGFVTLTRVKVSPDLQLARVYYTQMGDEKERKETARALERAIPFLRRQIAARMRLRRVPELRFQFDESVEHQDRIERILLELDQERKARALEHPELEPPVPEDPGSPAPSDDEEPECSSARAVAAALDASQSFILVSHARPDGDAVGSMVALGLALEARGKHITLVSRDPVPEPYRTFPAVDRIVRAQRVDAAADAVVLLECSDPTRPELAGVDRYPLINIDHHLGNTMYGAVNWFEPGAAACGEMVADVIDALSVAWTPAIAAHLYLAITTDTGGFRYGPITARTFETCRRIVDAGVDPALLSRQIFDSFGLGRVKLMGAILGQMRLYHGNRAAVLAFDDELLAACGATVDDTEGLVNLPLGASEVAAVALLKRQGPDTFRVSLRSKGEVDVRAVAARWQGGGHKNAAGCSLTGPREAVEAALVAALGDALRA